MENWSFLTASEIAEAIRERRVSSVEVMEAHLRQIARHNPALNAIVTLDADGALARARDADDALRRGRPTGPLHGVPFTVKDALETAGVRTTAGWPPLAEHVPKFDATAVARIKAAGGIFLGKTNVPPLSASTQTVNAIFGVTNNPWDTARTPGGSTGGGAAAVAAGMSPLEIGADIGGSLRLPAAYCGIFSLKPTEHRVPNSGHIPPPPGAPNSIRHMNVIGPMARSVDDLELALHLIAGPDRFDWQVPPGVPFHQHLPRPFKDLKLAWTANFRTQDYEGLPITRDMRDAFLDLVALLEGAAGRVEEALPDGYRVREADATWENLLAAERDWTLLRDGRGAWMPTPNMQQYTMLLMYRDERICALERFFETWDALICPTAAGPAFPHALPLGEDDYLTVEGRRVRHRLPTTCYTTHFNMTGHPVVSMPLGLSPDGLPLGVQIVGRRWDEGGILSIARRLSRLLAPAPHPPGYDTPLVVTERPARAFVAAR